MAIAALSNFTVPLNSDQSASSQGMLMPKLKYRFRISFENFGTSGSTTELTKQVQEAVRPQVKFANQIIEIYNSKINYAGKPNWEAITVKLRDDATNAVSTLVGEQIQKQFDFLEQSSAPSGISYKFSVEYDILDGGNGNTTPTVLEQWSLIGCFLSSVDYGDMAYNSNDPVQIACNIRFDNAVQTIGAAGSLVGWTTQATTTPGDTATGGEVAGN